MRALRLSCLLLAALLGPSVAAAQDAPADTEGEGEAPPSSRDEEARRVFEAGSLAFDDARYEDALGYFQRAYELSARAALLYNIGVAADRLRRDQEALEAFESFLEQVPDHPRRRDVEVRVEVLRRAVAGGGGANTGGETDGGNTSTSETTTPPPSGGSSGPDALTLGGSIALMGLGVAGIVTAVVGLAGAGGCLEEVAGTCVEERQVGWAGVGVWGGLGVAALAAGVIWLIVGMSGGDDEDAAVSMGPNGELQWRF